MLGYSFSFKAYAKKVRENKTECSLKTTEVLLYSDGHMFSFKFIEVEQVQIALRATQTLDALIFFFNFCLISGLKFALSDVRSFLPDNQSALKKECIQACVEFPFIQLVQNVFSIFSSKITLITRCTYKRLKSKFD